MAQENLPAVIQTAITEQKIDRGNVNMILPTESFGGLVGEYEKITLEVVRIDPDTKDGEVYEPNGANKGKALSKVPLLRIANAVGLVWVPAQTTVIESSERKSRAKATALFRKANGEWIAITEEKTVDLDALEEKQRIKSEEDAEKGPLLLDKYGKIVWHKNPTYPERDPAGWKSAADRDRYIDKEVRKSLIQYRLYKDERAMTGAKERVIRAVLAIKNVYTDAELSRPFAFPRIVADTSAMMRDPATRNAAIGMMTGKVAEVFGEGEPAEPVDEAVPGLTATVVDEDVVDLRGNPEYAGYGGDPFDQPPEPEAEPDVPPEDEQLKDAKLKLKEWTRNNVIQRNKGVLATIDTVLLDGKATLEQVKKMIDRCDTYAAEHAKK